MNEMINKPEMLNQANLIEFYPASTSKELELPLVEYGISAGFPSPADDFIDTGIDLNRFLVKHPDSTFYGRVRGDSMRDVGIQNGDLLIIDKILEPREGSIAVCFIDGGFTVKKIKMDKDCCWLVPANDAYSPIKVTEENDFLIWGIVINVIKFF